MQIFLNDRIVAEQEALISVFDHGFLYGDGIYETMRAYDGIVFMLKRHIERLAQSAQLMHLEIPPTDFISGAVYDTMKANSLKNAYIRVTISRGKGPIGLDPALCKKPTFVVIAEEFREYPDSLYNEGVRLIIAKTRRNLIDAVNPKIKSLNFLNNIFAKMEAKERGAYEAVMLNADGFITEGTISNIFFVIGGVLCTPSAQTGLLEGITRQLVISLADRNGIKVNEGKFYPADIIKASEIFITNTTSELMPVSQFEDAQFPVGVITKKLHGLYKELVAK